MTPLSLMNSASHAANGRRDSLGSPFYSGQSTSGYICWTIASNDGAGLELYFGSGTLDYPGTTWFALHHASRWTVARPMSSPR